MWVRRRREERVSVCVRESDREKEIKIRTDVSVQWRLQSACLDWQIRLFADQLADAGYEDKRRDMTTDWHWERQTYGSQLFVIFCTTAPWSETNRCFYLNDRCRQFVETRCVAVCLKSISLLQGFWFQAGSPASVRDLTSHLELVRETGGGRETRESVQFVWITMCMLVCLLCVCLCERETQTVD